MQGDPGRIKQIVVNLLNNAIKFTHSGDVVLQVRKHRQTSTKVDLEISVSDTGIGIAEADIPRLFQPFQQIDASVTRRFGGTGLGLAICKQLAEYELFSLSLGPAYPRAARWERRFKSAASSARAAPSLSPSRSMFSPPSRLPCRYYPSSTHC